MDEAQDRGLLTEPDHFEEVDVSDNSQLMTDSREPSSSTLDPVDKFRFTYFAMGFLGAGFLFPWSSTLSALDYYIIRYPGYRPEFYFPLVYMVVTTATMLFVVFVGVDRFHLVQRIRFGYCAFIIAMVSTVLVEHARAYDAISVGSAFALNCLIVTTTSLGSGVQQSSFYGYSAVMPRQYTQSLMTGEGLAGILVSLNRIITKGSYPDTLESLDNSTFTFFYVSISYLVLCLILYEIVQRMPFSQHYTGRRLVRRHPQKQTSDDSLELTSLTSNESATSLDALIDSGVENQAQRLSPPHSIRRGDIVRKVAWPSLGVFMCFFVSLSVFPGVTVSVPTGSLGSWSPVLLIATYNLFDFIGRMLTTWPIHWHRVCANIKTLTALCVGRLAWLPLMMLCAVPADHPYISGAAFPFLLVGSLALANGYLSTCMMEQAPELVSEHEREVTGVIMAFMLLCGLLAGASFANVLAIFISQ